MPIKKRKNIPVGKTRKSKTEYKSPGRPIEQVIKEHDRLASDAAWEGDEIKALHHQDVANRFRSRLEDGELYVIEF